MWVPKHRPQCLTWWDWAILTRGCRSCPGDLGAGGSEELVLGSVGVREGVCRATHLSFSSTS